MSKYLVSIVFGAGTYVEVEAESPEEAEDKALAERSHVMLCHYCSHKLEIADVTGCIVTDENGEVVLDSTRSE